MFCLGEPILMCQVFLSEGALLYTILKQITRCMSIPKSRIYLQQIAIFCLLLYLECTYSKSLGVCLLQKLKYTYGKLLGVCYKI